MDYRTLPDSALLRAADIHRPNGPYPGGRSKWFQEVKDRRAPQPIHIGRMAAWRWADVRSYLDELADAAGQQTT